MISPKYAQVKRTGTPDKYPQKCFKEKYCRKCKGSFNPQSPSQLYCGDACATRAAQDRYYIRNYGIDADHWETMFSKQNGVCFICETEGFTMKEHHSAKLMVDHCHVTGKVRGLLCHNCNRALGLLKDDRKAIQRALDYLEGATTIPEGSTLK